MHIALHAKINTTYKSIKPQEFEVSSINRAKIPKKNLALFMEETSNSCDKTNLKACRTFTSVDLIFAVLMKFRTADKKLF